MNQDLLTTITQIVTKALVDIALLVIPILTAYAANALRKFAADRQVHRVLTMHELLAQVARQAVLAVEQTMTATPGPAKKQAALSRAIVELGSHGVPITTETPAALDDAIEAQVLLYRATAGRGSDAAMAPASAGTNRPLDSSVPGPG